MRRDQQTKRARHDAREMRRRKKRDRQSAAQKRKGRPLKLVPLFTAADVERILDGLKDSGVELPEPKERTMAVGGGA